MNSDSNIRYITWAVAVFGPVLARWGVDSVTSTALISGVVSEGIQLAPVAGAAAFAIWHGWSKRLVHETAVVTSTAPSVADAKAASISAGK